jgi:alkylation response protein AidB-like acyl-CoA dehydrogenase
MDFEWTDEHRAFRDRVRAAVDSVLPDDWAAVSGGYDNGSDGTVAMSRVLCPALAEKGLLFPHWPKELGGEGLDAYHHWIINEEMQSRGEPRAYQYMNVNWVGPALARFGTPEQKALHLPRITSGTISYCQGFSEPQAGSDLGSLKTRAEPTANGYRINGQKIWTSAASFADYCFLLARTGEEKGSRAISVFLVAMNLPGITVRRIPSLQGHRAIHEVFFDDVDVKRSDLVGEENAGWSVVRAVLADERVGVPRYAMSGRALRHALEHLRVEGRLTDLVKVRAARCEAAMRVARLMALRIIDQRVKGRSIDSTASVARYAMAPAERMIAEFLAEFVPELLFKDVDPVVAIAYRRSASFSIAAGTAEIQLDQIARHVLNLPKAA